MSRNLYKDFIINKTYLIYNYYKELLLITFKSDDYILDTIYVYNRIFRNRYISSIVNNRLVYNRLLNYIYENGKDSEVASNIILRRIIDKKDVDNYNIKRFDIIEDILNLFINWYNIIDKGDMYEYKRERDNIDIFYYYYKFNSIGLLNIKLFKKVFLLYLKKLKYDKDIPNEILQDYIREFFEISKECNDYSFIYYFIKKFSKNIDKIETINSDYFFDKFYLSNDLDNKRKIQELLITNFIDIDINKNSDIHFLNDNRKIMKKMKEYLNNLDEHERYNKMKIIKNSILFKEFFTKYNINYNNI